MTKEEIKELLDNTKVYVNGKSKEIQEKLFHFGYKWLITEGEVLHEDKPFLFIHERGEITYSDDMMWFVNHENREITAEQILSLQFTKSYRPFKNGEECWNEMQKHQPFGWVMRRSKYRQILGVSDSGIRLADLFCTFEQAADGIFPDGIPFGIEE